MTGATALILWSLAVVAAPRSVASSRLAAMAPPIAPGRGRVWGCLSTAVEPAMFGLPLVVGLVACVLEGPLPAVAVALVWATVLEMRRRFRTRRRTADQTSAWLQMLDIGVASLRSGASPQEAFGRAAERVDAQVGRVVTSAVAVGALGGDSAAALADGGGPVGRELAGAWALAQEHGVPLADILERVRGDLAERTEQGRRVESSLAGPQATGVVLGALPLVGILLGSGLGADPVGVFTTGLAGGALAVVGATLLCGGVLWTDAIISGARS